MNPQTNSFILYSANELSFGRILKRINRFVVEIEIEGEKHYAHNTNTGRLKEYLVEGRKALFKRISGRKLDYRLIAVEDKYGYALIDTISQSIAFEKMVENGMISWMKGCKILSRHPRVLDSRLDYLVECKGIKVFIETKSAVLRVGYAASYPDCPSIRGRRHIRDLIKLKESGVNAMLVFIAALPKVECFKPYEKGDSIISQLIMYALTKGVPIKAISLSFNESGQIVLENDSLPICQDWLGTIQT